MKIALVTTTIHVPHMLETFCQSVSLTDQISFFVVGDLKTPLEAKRFCQRLSDTYNLPIEFLSIEDQEKQLAQYPELLSLFPYNCGDRKMLGVIIAFLRGFDLFTMVDDDNFADGTDFFESHKMLDEKIPLFSSSTGWFNVCRFLKERASLPIVQRGFPWKFRNLEETYHRYESLGQERVVHASLWRADPDVDAISRLYAPLYSEGLVEGSPPIFGLQPGTWCPFNNQSTTIKRDVLPAYFTPHVSLRYSDLFPSYVVCKIAGWLDHIISFGEPLVLHERNDHNLWEDLEKERVGYRCSEPFVDELRKVHLSGNTYHKCFGEIITHFEKLSFSHLPSDQRNMIEGVVRDSRIYHDCFEEILHGS